MTARPGGGKAALRIFRLWDYALVAVLAAIFFSVVAELRVVDDDEGFYALAGRALLEGRIPYRDFFFPQLPLTPVIYGAIRELFGAGLGPLRAFAGCSAAVTALLVHHAARRISGPAGGLLAFLCFAAHLLVWEWAATVKTFPIAFPLSLGAVIVATSSRLRPRRAAAAGLLAGAALGARLLVAPVIVCVLLACWVRPMVRSLRWRCVFAALGGFFIALVPVFVLAAMAPQAFWFDNVVYHAVRGEGPALVESFHQKLEAARTLFLAPLGSTRPDSTGLQTTPLLIATGFAAFGLRTIERSEVVWATMAALLFIVSFLPSPVWTQYFALVVAPAAVLVGGWIGTWRGWRKSAGFVLAMGYAATSVLPFLDRVTEAHGVFRPAHFDDAGRLLDSVTRTDDVVAAHFPAYLVASSRPILAEAQNQFARLYSERVPADQRRRLHLYTEADLRAALLSQRAQAFVVGMFVVPETALALKEAGWRQRAGFAGGSIWIAPDSGKPP